MTDIKLFFKQTNDFVRENLGRESINLSLNSAARSPLVAIATQGTRAAEFNFDLLAGAASEVIVPIESVSAANG